MTPLGRLLARRIELSGPIPVAVFMAEALGHPAHGYYVTRDPLGARGDFTTAPEISQLFGESLAVWAIETWQRMGAPSRAHLVELGPGRGTLLQDLLRVAKAAPDFAAAVDLHLVETSPTLRAAQAQRLDRYGPRWHQSFDTVPDDAPLLLIANELFDALPIRQFVRVDGAWHERLVGLDENGAGFRFVLAPGRSPLAAGIAPSDAPDGSVFELSPASLSLMGAIASRIAARTGCALVIDYAGGVGDTLQAVRGHARADVLVDPGESDLTAHVDFTALARVARESGAVAHGPLGQGELLQRLGITARFDALCERATDTQAKTLASGLTRLVSDDGMGVLFRAIAIGTDGLVPCGFEECGVETVE
ncbi:class I SAM-dependent methyltransferase [Roseiterribacter gracilis]|uniref:TetR family transcriptional regulator n=1 Tax=Roseiterribacter gracilis TaxID=2812848 RepID=A0A8S8X8X2_9PROT|nr:TetR family transcriptional regulator [Rhodospirillales bacterium TMPK1]